MWEMKSSKFSYVEDTILQSTDSNVAMGIVMNE